MNNEKNTQENEKKLLEYKGFPLFNEIEDEKLKQRNQAVIMVNILEDNYDQGKIKAKGTQLILGYMSLIPKEDRVDLMKEFVRQANERGFKIQ